MDRLFSLAQLTVIDLAPPQVVAVAAEAGYGAVGLHAPAAAPPTVAAISEEARYERLFPGDGGLPLVDFVRALPPDLALALEVPMRQLALTMPPVGRVRRALQAARTLVAQGSN